MLKPSAEPQSCGTVLMVPPTEFAFNAETAATNSFAEEAPPAELNARVLAEFDGLASALAAAGVEVLRPAASNGPDAVFPNNWVSFHADGTAVLYPMATLSRREERKPDAVRQLLDQAGFGLRRLIDLTPFEMEERYLEGTGSLVFDRPARRAFACLGPRTHGDVIDEFDRQLGYETLTFEATGPDGRPIYHTNVVMSLGRRFAVVCLDAVSANDRRRLVEALRDGGRTVVPVDWSQLCRFACNILELCDASGEPLLALSSGALRCLTSEQREALETLSGKLVHAEIPTIERVGGGGVRCMLAEVHLPRAG